ncbi:hypothetical protein ABZW02_31295 [Streptomyces sp. NPDC005180]|uniref:hypothetical protein n=1 Tax=Streptomyces sp. NPDC005180 TaxID=3156868 RepID=UPI0033B51477
MPDDQVRLAARERRADGHAVHSVVVYMAEVADTIQAVEEEGWRLDHVGATAYPHSAGQGSSAKALLVFRRIDL